MSEEYHKPVFINELYFVLPADYQDRWIDMPRVGYKGLRAAEWARNGRDNYVVRSFYAIIQEMEDQRIPSAD